MHSVRRLGAVGPHLTFAGARGARDRSTHGAGLAITAGLHPRIAPHGPDTVLQVAFTIVGHSPALALAPGSLALRLTELSVLHLDGAIVVVPIVVLMGLLVPATGVAVAAALHARIAPHVPNAGLQVALVVVGHGPTDASAPAPTAHAFALVNASVGQRTLVVAAIVVVPVPGAATIVSRSRTEASTQGARHGRGRSQCPFAVPGPWRGIAGVRIWMLWCWCRIRRQEWPAAATVWVRQPNVAATGHCYEIALRKIGTLASEAV